MHLENQSGLELLLPELAGHIHHGQLDDVCGGPLHRHVQRHALPEGADVEVAALQLRQITAAAKERVHIAVLFRLGHDLLHIIPNAVVLVQIRVHIGLGFVWEYPDILGQGEGGDAVDNAEIDCLGAASQDGRDLLDGDTEDPRGGDGVEILPA